MNKSKISISLVSLVSLLVFTLLSFGIFGTIYYNHLKKLELEKLNENLETTVNQLSKGLSVAVWNFDEDQIKNVLKSGLQNKSIDAVSIELNDIEKTRLSIVRDASLELKIVRTIAVPKPDAIILSAEISYDDENIGKVIINGTSQFVLEELKKETKFLGSFILLVIGLLISGVVYIYFTIVIKPLKYLEQYALAFNFENYNSNPMKKKKFFKEPENLGLSLQKMVTTLGSNYKKLEESEKRFKDMTNLLPVSVYETDLNGKLTFINKTGLAMFGYNNDDLERGLSILDFISSDDKERAALNAANILNGTKNSGGNEYNFVKQAFVTFPARVYSLPILLDGKIIGMRGVGIDLTIERENETKLHELTELNYKKEKEAEKLRALSLIEGQEEERLRISREIHDGIGQMMTAIKLSMEGINSSLENAENDKFEYTKSLVHEVISELRQVSKDLSPTFLYEYGLYPSVNQLTNGINRMDVIQANFNSNIQEQRFSSFIEITLYRIIQEVINNALKYSKASVLIINLIQDAEFLELSVIDDGIGFDMASKSCLNGAGGNGLRNMASRANLLGAEFKITSSPGEGTQISLQIPIEDSTLISDELS
ncbi:PAS domain-containing sensor histidine kinase [Aurantibacillus circumpalustris]|uniref:PAS domain-containing sensor histidine kinase n=1 Tax=Aurantibacillus circumpalustris TaxID=3036359 RepID=UPI00295A919B|nr:PAS domain-containing sensor histidine kinase [Aurantibacillus circumpalustris]